MREKILAHAGFAGPVKIEDMERTRMYRDYLAQIKDTSFNTLAVNEKKVPKKKTTETKPGDLPNRN
ncbi:MAG TPA: hypothetical protein DEF34_08450 [Desulfotomaculum sp.]|nr:MAG: hypothetical protein JL56_16930 [Desulfotomaculum sp. BICA1-6]HBX23642.1 hypothetical protein [Desulfotomaculum sp.]